LKLTAMVSASIKFTQHNTTTWYPMSTSDVSGCRASAS
jgi:hypothetical protein